jgi:hypothetical protein
MSKSPFIKLIVAFVIVLAVVGVGWKILKPDHLTTTEGSVANNGLVG